MIALSLKGKGKRTWTPCKRRIVGSCVLVSWFAVFLVKRALLQDFDRHLQQSILTTTTTNSTFSLASDQSSTVPSTTTSTADILLTEFSIQKTSSSKVIFYHVYLPPHNLQNALRIVEEQIGQMGNKDVTLMYNTIGDPNALPDFKMDQWCQQYNLTACHHLNHYAAGFEETTLHNVYQYCRRWPTDRVGYVHNKGSLNTRQQSEIWRYLMTESLVRDECWNTSAKEQQQNSDEHQSCNACGLFFTRDWGVFFAGNVWTANCGYINQLIPPLDYERKARASYQDALLRRELGQFEMTLFDLKISFGFVGIGRFAAEWWIASHPTVRPCDFSKSIPAKPPKSGWAGYPTMEFLDWLTMKQQSTPRVQWKELLTNDNFVPQAPGLPYNNLPIEYDDGKMREYHLLAGRIHRWLRLYGELPPQDSWVWTNYPRGLEWKSVVERHGTKVLDEMMPIEPQWMANDVPIHPIDYLLVQ